ncbi:hypothetical protein VP424E501_P0094 [Vibrio phage 424E50-1]|nr:hypothetical protein VP424E501_P0094 [Vibrio phage 424E50-1]
MTLDQLMALGLGSYLAIGVGWLITLVLREKHYNLDKLLAFLFFGHSLLGLFVATIIISFQLCIKQLPKWFFKEWK